MKRFSPSDLSYLRGKARDAVEQLFVELRDVVDVAKTLLSTPAAVWAAVHRARQRLAAMRSPDFPFGIALPDRRFAISLDPSRADVF